MTATTAKSVRVLLVEDSDADAELVRRALQAGGYAPSIERVHTESGMLGALAHGPWDVVLCDYSLPGFGAMRALTLLHSSSLGDVPLLIVSGSIGEESAVEALKAGAADVVSKQNLGRLAPAVD